MKEEYEAFRRHYEVMTTTELGGFELLIKNVYDTEYKEARELKKRAEEAEKNSNRSCARLQAINDIILERMLPPKKRCPECGRQMRKAGGSDEVK